MAVKASSRSSARKPKLSFSVNVPRRISIPRRINTLYLLMTIIVVGAFILGLVLGVLITKIQYLEKGIGTTTTSTPNTSGNTTPAADVTTPVNVGVGHLPAQGDPNSKVKIVEFADFRCPFCEQFYKSTKPQIIKEYVDSGKAVFYFRHYAFLGPASVVAANASECANDQGKFWDMHNYLYSNQPSESDTSMYTVEKLTAVAGTLGMDTGSFNSCLSANTDQKNIDTDMSEGSTAGVTGTPTTFINGMLFSGACPYSNFKQAIDFAVAGTPFKISGADGCSVSAQ